MKEIKKHAIERTRTNVKDGETEARNIYMVDLNNTFTLIEDVEEYRRIPPDPHTITYIFPNLNMSWKVWSKKAK